MFKLNSGNEEQYTIDNCQKIIEDTKKKLNLEEVVQQKSNETIDSGINKANVRVRTNGMPHDLPSLENNITTPNQTSYYSGMPTYKIESNNKAYAAVLIIMEVVSLIFLVSLITFVVLKGIS